MTTASTAFLVKTGTDMYKESKKLVQKVAKASDHVRTTGSYPEENPHPDKLFKEFEIQINSTV